VRGGHPGGRAGRAAARRRAGPGPWCSTTVTRCSGLRPIDATTCGDPQPSDQELMSRAARCHLPLADLGGGLPTAGDLVSYATAARELGFATLSANEPPVSGSGRGWDGPTGAGQRGGRRGGPDPGHQPGRSPWCATRWWSPRCWPPSPPWRKGPVVGGPRPGVEPGSTSRPSASRTTSAGPGFDEALRVVRGPWSTASRPDPAGFYPGHRMAPLSLDPAPADRRPQNLVRQAGGPTSGWAAMASVADGWFSRRRTTPPRSSTPRPGPGWTGTCGPPAESPTRSPTPWRPPGST
jgi:hypothetical protein